MLELIYIFSSSAGARTLRILSMDQSLEAYLKALLCLMEQHRLAELQIEEPDFKVKLSMARAMPEVVSHQPLLPQRSIPHRQMPAIALPEVVEKNHHNYYEFISPLVGVFYRASTPDSPPFVEVGDFVKAGQVVCLIEAMKVFNEICAERSGRVIEVCSKNGDVVEADQVLMLIDPAAAPEGK